CNLARGPNFYVDGLLGFRYLWLHEGIDITQVTNLLPGGVVGFNGSVLQPPGSLGILDQFVTRNQFYGGQIGTRAEYERDALFVHLLGKLGLGGTHQDGFINGTSTLGKTGGPNAMVQGGVLALSSNIGRLEREVFSVVPELGINVGVQYHCLRVFVG